MMKIVMTVSALIAIASAGLLGGPIAYSSPILAAPVAHVAPIAVKAAVPVATSYQNTYKISQSAVPVVAAAPVIKAAPLAIAAPASPLLAAHGPVLAASPFGLAHHY